MADQDDIHPERRGGYLFERLAAIEKELEISKRLVTLETLVDRLIKDEESDRAIMAKIEVRLRVMEGRFFLAIGAVIAADYLFRMFVK